MSRTPRFFASSRNNFLIPGSELSSGSVLTIAPEEVHHLQHVLRLKPNDCIEVLDRSSTRTYLCKLISVQKNSAQAEIIQPVHTCYVPPITLIVGIIKSAKCNFIVEKGVELGVKRIVFFRAERTQGNLTTDLIKKCKQRFDRIAQAALKQSGSYDHPPQVDIKRNLREVLSALHQRAATQPQAGEWRFVFHPSYKAANTPEVATILTATLKEKSLNINSLACKTGALLEGQPLTADSYIIIGPEGGLSDAELELARDYQYVECALGSKVLKTETAAIVASSVIGVFRKAVSVGCFFPNEVPCM